MFLAVFVLLIFLHSNSLSFQQIFILMLSAFDRVNHYCLQFIKIFCLRLIKNRNKEMFIYCHMIQLHYPLVLTQRIPNQYITETSMFIWALIYKNQVVGSVQVSNNRGNRECGIFHQLIFFIHFIAFLPLLEWDIQWCMALPILFNKNMQKFIYHSQYLQ